MDRDKEGPSGIRTDLEACLASVGASREGDRTDLAQVDVTDVYSPPRVNLEADKFGLTPGDSMDLRTGFDFSKKADHERASRKIREDEPTLLIGSPECTMFSTLQNMSKWTLEKSKKLQEAKVHMDFMCICMKSK